MLVFKVIIKSIQLTSCQLADPSRELPALTRSVLRMAILSYVSGLHLLRTSRTSQKGGYGPNLGKS